MSRTAVAIVASTRAARGNYSDRTGPLICAWFLENGFDCGEPVVVEDGPGVEAELRAAVASGAALVVTTGGTGVGKGDGTADATASVVDRQLPGIAEELRRRGSVSTPGALLSRGIAGIAGSTVIVNLPGSVDAVQSGLQLLGELVEHLLQQLAGGSHD